MAKPIHRDEDYMAAAIRLGERHLGRTAPNPSVGVLIIKDGAVVGRGVTQQGGRPHGEAVALTEAGAAAQGATAFVSLEPCSHHGKTPPCTDALIAAGIARVVYAIGDPDPRVAGKSAKLLRDAGIDVRAGVCEEAARLAHAGHILLRKQGRPLVTLKLAISADGYIAAAGRMPVQITGEQALNHSHMLRATHDAIMVGIGTVIADNPRLTCRLPGMAAQSPVRIIIDPNGRTPIEAAMLGDNTAPVWIAGKSADSGVARHIRYSGNDTVELLHLIGDAGITRLLVEGGAETARRLLKTELADEILIYQGSIEIGSGGLLPFVDEGLAAIEAGGAYDSVETAVLGRDRLTRYRRKTFLSDLG